MRKITLSDAAVAILSDPALGGDRPFDAWPDQKRCSSDFSLWKPTNRNQPQFRLHDLRHAYSVDYLTRNPTRLRPLSQYLGHTTVSTTERYYLRFLSDEQQRLAAQGQIGPNAGASPERVGLDEAVTA
jgi:integrase